MKTMHASAVIWDMDGVIFDTERLRVEAWEDILRERGQADDARSKLLKAIGKNKKESNEIFLREFGADFPVAELRIDKENRVHERIKREGIPLKPGVREALSFLKEKKIPCAIASSSYRELIADYLERGGLTEFFSVIVGGDEVKKGKPDPEIFLIASKKLGISPEKCVVVEDSHYGIEAAHAAGMQVIMIPDLLPPNASILEKVHHACDTGAELIELLGPFL